MADSITVLLRDPLSKEARAERRTLLGASAIGILIVRTGLVPTKIAALGIEFDQADRKSLLLAIAAVIAYFLIGFIIYALSDFIAWRFAFMNTIRQNERESEKEEVEMKLREREERKRQQEEGSLDYEPIYPLSRHYQVEAPRDIQVLYRIHAPVSVVRAAFEFILPIAISIYAVVTLLRFHG